MDSILIRIGGLILIGGGCVPMYLGIQPLKIFFDCKPCKVYEVAIGNNVHIKGSIAIDNHLKSPFTQTNCAFWHGQVKETKGSGKHRTVITHYDQHSEAPIMLTDGTGQIEVMPAQVKLRQPPHFKDWQGALNRFKDDRSAQVLEDLDISPKGMLFKRNISIVEHVLQPGQAVYVWGKAVQSPQSAGRGIRPRLMSDRRQSAFYFEIVVYCLFGLPFILVGLSMVINVFGIWP